MSNKSEITQRIIDLRPAGAEEITMHEAMTTWYQNIRDTGGMRLTFHGYQTFKLLEIESWDLPLTDVKKYVSKIMLLDLDRKMKYPYFIDYKNKRMIMFSSRDAMMAALYGDLAAWLKNQ
jgi:hypothetical protein